MTARVQGHIAVIDIGKTNAKLALVDPSDLSEIAVLTRPNTVLPGPPWPHFDVEGHWDFLLDALTTFHVQHGIAAITVTTHGASAVLLGHDGQLAAPVLDYEHDGPDALAAKYGAIRPDFSQTGSPNVGVGLNVGAQFHWQFAIDPGLRDRVAHIVTYPQYWGYRLTGIAATDVTSLGSHTDLWNPHEGRFSQLVDRLGIAGIIAAPRDCADILGPVLPEVATRTGLAPGTPVYCGIHDSNASLLPHILGRSAPFSVVSTGTWVIVMTIGGERVTLNPAQDTLIYVNALGQPVPSARFMGGREFDIAMGGITAEASPGDIDQVLDSAVMLLPAVQPGIGPFRGRDSRWVGPDPAIGSGRRAAAVGFYLALVTTHCLTLTGHRGPVIVEGPFARNRPYLEMLAVACAAPVIASGGATGTSQGAAMLVTQQPVPLAEQPVALDPTRAARLATYAANWSAAVGLSDS